MADGDGDDASSRRRRGPFRGRRRLAPRPAQGPVEGTSQPQIQQKATAGHDVNIAGRDLTVHYHAAGGGDPQPEPLEETPLEDLPVRNPDKLETLPVGTAQLHICRKKSSDGTRLYFVEARCFCSPFLVKVFDNGGSGYGRPGIAIKENLRKGGPSPRKYLQEMRIWSRSKRDLTRWLYDHRKKHGELRLVIWDDTDHRIPWELLWLRPNRKMTGPGEPEPGYLGAVLTVSRWVHILTDFPENIQDPFDPAINRSSGPVASYIAVEMADDETLLTDFTVEPAKSMERLFQALAAPSGELAMVYVACHGEFDSKPEECQLDGFSYGRAVEFDDELCRLQSGPLVFLNSCDSGLFGIDTGKYNDGALRGFAEVFLSAGAAGVLATTGAIGKDEARVLAGGLFKHLTADAELPVAQAVRELRHQALKKMNMNPQWFDSELSDEELNAANHELLPLLYPFMYVYFGNPWLRVSPARQGSAGISDSDPAGNQPSVTA